MFFIGMDFRTFFLGFIFCMLCDLFYTFCNFFIQKALDLRHKRREHKPEH